MNGLNVPGGLGVSVVLCLSSCAWFQPDPSPYIEVFGDRVAQMANEYKQVVEGASMIEERAAVVRISGLSAPTNADYRTPGSIGEFLTERTKLLDVLTSYANLLQAVMIADDSERIVRCVELAGSASELPRRGREATVREVFLDVSKASADPLTEESRGTRVQGVMGKAQKGIEAVADHLKRGNEEFRNSLGQLSEDFEGLIRRIRKNPDLSWSERMQLDEMALRVAGASRSLREDLSRLETAVAALPELHHLVAENVFNILQAESVVSRLSALGRRYTPMGGELNQPVDANAIRKHSMKK